MSAPVPEVSTRRMLDQYEIVAEIASGGMGTVYLARLARTGGFQRMVALKLLHRHLAEEPGFVAMLLDEARLAARLHHPNAVGIYDVRESALGYYLVMDFVDGFSMDEVLDAARDDEERWRLGLRILLDGATGLDAAHRLQDDEGKPLSIVHRDVSPQNILVGRDGVGRITDFGVARAAERITSSRPGTIKGKPCYMAPEQAQATDLDARADVFALGIVLWEVLSGELLFQSEHGTATILLAVLQQEIAPPSSVAPGVHPALDAVCMKALRRPLEDRYGSAREFCVALREAATAAGMLADSHAVAETLATLFAERVDARQRSIRHHVSAIEKLPEAPMTAADLFSIPKLGSTVQPGVVSGVRAGDPSQSGGWHETPAPRDAESIPGQVDPISQTVQARSLPAEAAAPAMSSGAYPDATERSTSKKPLWLLSAAVLLLGLAIAAVAALTLMSEDEPPPAATLPPAPAVVPTSVPPVGDPSEASAQGPGDETPETDRATGDAASENTDSPASELAGEDSTTPEGEAPPEAEEADAPTSRRRRGRRAGREPSSTPAPAAMEMEMEPAPAPMTAPPRPAIEANPYQH